MNSQDPHGPSGSAPRWMSDADVAARVRMPAAIDRLAQILRSEVRGAAVNMPKTMATWDPKSSAHALGAYDPETGVVAFKTWVNTPSGATAIVNLFDSVNGKVIATLEAATLGSLRTSGLAGLATSLLSSEDAEEMALIGTGRQALYQIEAVMAVRSIRRVRVWSPTPESRQRFAVEATEKYGLLVEAAESPEKAVEGMPIVSLISRAQQPFLKGESLARGAHVNAVGAILPASAEMFPSVLKRSTLTVVDNLDNARRSSRELKEAFGEDFSSISTLGQLVAMDGTRPNDPDLTVYKGMGTGLADLAIASLAMAAS